MRKYFSFESAFLILIILLTMYNNLEHTSKVYLDIAENKAYSPLYNRIHSYLVMIVIDLAVIAFIWKAKKQESAHFAWLLFVVNLIFFDALTDVVNICRAIKEQDPDQLISLINALLAKVIFSGIFSYTIHRFSFLFYEKRMQAGTFEQVKARNEQLKAEKEHLESRSEDLFSKLKEMKSSIEQLKTEKDLYVSELTCEHCNAFTGDISKGLNSALKSLNAHKGICAKQEKRAIGKGLSAILSDNNHTHASL